MQLELDLTFLHTISNGDQEFINDVLQTFLEEMPKDMQTLQTAIDSSDITAIGKMAHKTKSTLQTLGLAELKELAFSIEQDAKNEENAVSILTEAARFKTHVESLYPAVKALIQ